MARHLLTARHVQAAGEGDHSDGDGLYLRVKVDGKSTGTTASWVFRYTAPSGKRRELGLGAADRGSQQAAGASLTRARKAADAARDMLAEKPPRDPIDVKEQDREKTRKDDAAKKATAKSTATTLRRYARAYHAAHIEPIRADRHGREWLGSIERHAPASLLDTPIAAVTAIDLLDALVPVMRKVQDTGWRVYQRLGTVFDAAVIERLRPDNPAAPIRRELRKRAGRRDAGSHAAMPYRQVPGFVSDLRLRTGNAARCLEFTILTAARTGEALMAEWSELDLTQRTWTIPAAKMKNREQHVAYLCDRAVEILKGQAGQHARYVFPSIAGNSRPMSNMAMLIQLQRMGLWGKKVTTQRVTVHGFRATFSTWANELAIARPDVIEIALAHSETDRVRRAYNRSQFLADRRTLLIAWGNYCAGLHVTRTDGSLVTDAAVIQFPTAQQAAA
jgi:integrase